MRVARLALLASVLLLTSSTPNQRLAPASALADYDFDNATSRHPLAIQLREISGLTTTRDGRVFAHGDELASIAELDSRNGQVIKTFTVGSPVQPGDFEGIAYARNRFFLVTSAGLIYSVEEGKNNTAVPFQAHDSGAGRFCEIEGLAYDSVGDRLLLPCKTARRKEARGFVTIIGVPLRTMRMEETPAASIPYDRLPKSLRGGIRPTSIDVHPRTGSLMILSSEPQALVEVGRDGTLLGAIALSARAHRQPEGLTFTNTLTLLIADEGGTSAGVLTVYAQRKRGP